MRLTETLRNKRVKIREIPKWGPFLRKEWENQFASHLTEEEKRAIYLTSKHGYLWHLFSYRKKDCKEKGEAERAFDRQTKTSCYLFYQHSDDAVIMEDASKVTAADFAHEGGFFESDIYVVDKEFTWTYVRTHETGWCGPYFGRRM